MRVAVCDERLIELTGMGDDATEMAMHLAETQAWTIRHTGHLIAMNDEYVWRRVKAAAKGGGYRQIGVRCLFCGCVAPLGWWIDAAVDYMQDQAVPGADWHPMTEGQASRYLRECSGPLNSGKLIDTLHGLVLPLPLLEQFA